MKTASAKIDDARISIKHATVLCDAIRGKNFFKAQALLQRIADGEESLKGKYYTKAVGQFLDLMRNLEANARAKDLSPEKLIIRTAKADLGDRFMRPKSRYKMRGRRAKATNLTMVVG